MYLIFTIALVVWIYTLSQKVKELSQRFDELAQNQQKTVPQVESTYGAASVPSAQSAPVAAPSRGVPNEPTAFDHFIAWLRMDFMMKLGAFLMLCALGWFVSYAFLNDLIGEAGRITLGLVTGSLILVGGYWRIRTHVHQGGVLAVLGSTTILLTMFAARELYDMFTPASALFIDFLSVAFVSLLSVRYDRKPLAISSLILAALAPIFTSIGELDIMVQFTYLLVIVFGSLWIVYLRGWSHLTLSALIVVFLYGLPYLGTGIYSNEKDIALLFAFVFTTIFFVANILGLIANDHEKNHVPHLLIAFGTGIYLVLWILGAALPEWQSSLLAIWALVFSLGSFVVYRCVFRKEAFYIYGATSIALIGIATAAELEGPALTIALTLEVALITHLAARVFKNAHAATMLTLLYVIPITLSFEDLLSRDWNTGILHDSFFVLVILTIALALTGTSVRSAEEKTHDYSTLLFVGAGLYAVALVWLVLHAGSIFTYTAATFTALVLYTIAGLYCYMRGQRDSVTGWKYAGGALIALVMGRLLFVEVWNMTLSGRIITFFVIGAILLSTAFMRKQNKASLPDTYNQ